MPRANTTSKPAAAAGASTDQPGAAAVDTGAQPGDQAATMAAAAAAVQDDTGRTRRVSPTSLGPREQHSSDFPEQPVRDLKMPALGAGLPQDRTDSQIALADTHIDREYLAELAFMEEPVTIRIEPTNDDNPAMTVDCWVQGKGAEVWDDRTRRWLELNILPVGRVCTTKRKYVEVLARSKSMKVRTPDHGDNKNADNNTVSRTHHRGHVFSVMNDSPKGQKWLTAILNEAF